MPTIVTYSTPQCPWCHKVKEYLGSKNIAFTDYNVAEDQTKAEEMIHKSGQMGVPVIDIDGTIIVGFDEGKLRKLLGIK